MDTAQWMHQTADSFEEFGVTSKVGVSKTTGGAQSACSRPPAAAVMERKVRPQKDQALNCPRCHSTNTKFCYYNNYSLTQPRYFCKTCRRYWTQGGTLRNVPVGGGSRKNKKSTCISPSLTGPVPPIPSQRPPDLNPPSNISEFSSHNPRSTHDQGQDLNLGFQIPQEYHHHHHVIPHFLEFPKIENRDVISSSSSANSTASSAPLSALNFLSNGIAARELNSFIPMAPNASAPALFAPSGFPFQQCHKPTLGFSMNKNQSENCDRIPQENINRSLMFSFGAEKRHSNEGDQGIKGQENSNGYWNGMLGGGSSW